MPGGVSVPKVGCIVSNREDEFRRPATLKTVTVNGADAKMERTLQKPSGRIRLDLRDDLVQNRCMYSKKGSEAAVVIFLCLSARNLLRTSLHPAVGSCPPAQLRGINALPQPHPGGPGLVTSYRRVYRVPQWP